MFGYHDIPFQIKQENISISIQRKNESLVYQRECFDEKVEKILISKQSKILINPIEPVNKPKKITPYLLSEFTKTVVIEPKTTQRIYITFPIEIGVFVFKKNDFEVLDFFTITRQKFTFYGDPQTGELCRHWKTDVFSEIQKIVWLSEGILRLKMINSTDRWVEVKKVVFNAYGMKLYYNNEFVGMRGEMRITGKGSAETYFRDAPLEKGMNKSLEMYTVKKLSVVSRKFLMEEGI